MAHNNIDLEKFSGVMESISNVTPSSFNVFTTNGNETNPINDTNESLVSLKETMESQLDVLKGMLDIEQTQEQRDRRKEQFETVSSETPSPGVMEFDKGFFEELFSDMFEGLSDTSTFDFIKAAVFAPLLFEFTKSFVNELTDGMLKGIDLIDVPQIFASATIWSNIGSRFTETMSRMFSPLRNVVQTFDRFFTSPVGNFMRGLSSLTGMTPLLSAFRRIFLPLGAILSFWDGVKAFIDSDGTFIERLGEGVGATLGAFIGSFLDLLTDISAWSAGALGFDEVKKMLDDFSFRELIHSVVSDIFGLVSDSVVWIKDLFVDPKDALNRAWDTLLDGLNSGQKQYKSLLDIIFWPVDQAVQWISDIFEWKSGEDFSLTDIVWGAVDNTFEWIRELFKDPRSALDSLLNDFFSMYGIYDNFLDILYWPIDKAIRWAAGIFKWDIGEKFSLREETGFDSIFDLLADPINKAINWIIEKFWWSDSDMPVFDLQSIVERWAWNAYDWINSVFGRGPTGPEEASRIADELRDEFGSRAMQMYRENIQDGDFTHGELFGLQESILDLEDEIREGNLTENQMRQSLQELEELQRKMLELAEQTDEHDTREIIANTAEMMERLLRDADSFKTGSKGFEDFGKSSFAFLHGREAIVPEQTDAARFLERFFNDDWSIRPQAIEETVSKINAALSNTTMKAKYIESEGQQMGMNNARAQANLLSMSPTYNTSSPSTVNSGNTTTIINHLSPSKSLDDPSIPQ